MYENWIECEEPNVGWCLLCNQPIRSAEDLIPGTNSHNCAAGRELDDKIRAAEASEQNRKPPVHPAKRKPRPDSSGCSSVPDAQVGIFFWFDRKLFTEGTPLIRADRYADSLTHPNGHPDFWSRLQAAGSVPADTEYDEVSRGRVNYGVGEDRFLILRDRCIPAKAIRLVISTLHLAKSKVVVALDLHYRCPRCLAHRDQ
jgi:hypothetical protein